MIDEVNKMNIITKHRPIWNLIYKVKSMLNIDSIFTTEEDCK